VCKGILLSFNVFVDAQSFEFETNGHSIYKVIYFGGLVYISWRLANYG